MTDEASFQHLSVVAGLDPATHLAACEDEEMT
jgi:hypothetical protein